MTISFELGWWIAPTTITVLAFLWAYLRLVEPSGNVGADPLRVVFNGVLFLLAACASLIAWLIWSLAA